MADDDLLRAITSIVKPDRDPTSVVTPVRKEKAEFGEVYDHWKSICRKWGARSEYWVTTPTWQYQGEKLGLPGTRKEIFSHDYFSDGLHAETLAWFKLAGWTRDDMEWSIAAHHRANAFHSFGL